MTTHEHHARVALTLASLDHLRSIARQVRDALYNDEYDVASLLLRTLETETSAAVVAYEDAWRPKCEIERSKLGTFRAVRSER
jgi:hypothetical protein